MSRSALFLLLLVAGAVLAPAARAQIMPPGKSPTEGKQGQLDTSCGAWQKSRKTLNYFLMVGIAENFLRASVESIQDKQGIGGDPMKDVGDKEIAAWMDKYCSDRPESTMQVGAEAYAKVLVEGMPASARSEPRGGAPAAAAGGGPEAQPAAKKKSTFGFKIGRTCESWMSGRKGLDYYMMMNSAEEYLKGQVAVLREERGVAKDPMQGLTDKDIARRLDQYCPRNPKVTMEAALDAYASELVGGSAPARAEKPAAGGKPAAAAPATGAAAPAAEPAPRKPSSFKVGRSCESWMSGRKGLDYYLMVSSAEDYLKAEAAALAAERGVTRDPMQGVGSKQIATWLDQYCPQRSKEALETALNAYANELVGPGQAKPEAAAKPPAAAAGAAAPAPRKPSAFSVGRSCDSWNSGRKSLDYYLLTSKSEDYLKAEAAALAAERGVTRDPMKGVGSKEIAAWLDQYCAQRGREPLETALNAYANELVGPAPGQPQAARSAPAAQAPARPGAAPAAGAAAPAAAQGARDPLGLGGGRSCGAWTAGRRGPEYNSMIETSEAQLRNDVKVLRETRGVASDPLQSVSRNEIAAFLDGYCAERPRVPLESAVRVYANQLLSNLR